MKKLLLPFLTLGAVAVCVWTLAPLAAGAQNTTATLRCSPAATAAPRPGPTPALTVAASTDEENEPTPPLDPEAETSGQTETEILCTDGATFASKDRIAVFTGNVTVKDPRFQLACDKLTVFLNKSSSSDTLGPGAATPVSVSTPAPSVKGRAAAPAPTPGSSGGIDHAVAEGHVVIVQERAATQGGEAKRSVGRGDWANFDNKSGDMVLKGTPSVEQNENTHTATSPDTVMTLKKDNSLTTVGPSRTIIIQRKGSELPGAQPGQTTATSAQAPAANGRKPHRGSPAATPAPSGVQD